MKRILWLLLPLLTACNGPGGTRDLMEDNLGQAGQTNNKNNQNADIYINLAVAYFQENRMDIALQEGKKAVAANANSTNAHYILALIYQRLSKLDLADTHFKRSLAIDGQNFNVLNAYGSFLCQKHQFAESYKNFEASAGNPLNQQREIAFTNAGICAYGDKNTDKAEDYLRNALNANPRFAPAILQMLEITLDRKDFKAAQTYLQRYETLGPPTPNSLLAGARIAHNLGDKKALKKYSDLMRQSFPDTIQAKQLRELGAKS
jgi:type IV pilus assembly protein PilF